jgi:para-nitrobenzyl esterase
MTSRAVFATAAAVFVAAGTIPSRAAIQDPVRTADGQLAGVTLASGVRAFKGIPFAAPPVGDLRWREPQPAAAWDGVRKADAWGNVCMQNPAPKRANVNVATDLPDSPKTSEDCLFLNVWTQADSAKERRPVMVWIYGGAYTEGGGNSPHNDGENLAKKGVVLVTFNYRLGALGFFSHPELTKESAGRGAGNQALMDAIAALRWVQRNIAAFGGDPNNVTIFGESAGAAMVGMLTGSPVAKGLFQKAIAQSGAWMGLGMAAMTPLAQAEAAGMSAGRGGRGGGRGGRGGAPAAGAQAGAPPAPEAPPPTRTLAQLRALSSQEALGAGRGGPVIDGYVIPEDQSITFANGRQNPVDVIVGFNKDEHTGFGGADNTNTRQRDVMAWHMRLFAEMQTAIGRKAYFYVWTHEPPHEPDAPNLRATHAAEMVYVFNNLHAPRMIPDRSSPKLAMASEKDRAMADLMSSYWTNFARTGDPNGKGLPQWPVFRDRNAPPHVIGEIREYPSAETLNAFDGEYAKILAGLRGVK